MTAASVLLMFGTLPPASIHEAVSRVAIPLDSLSSATGQEIGAVPVGFTGVSVQKREDFWSRKNVAFGVGLFSSTIADAESSFACLGATRIDSVVLHDGTRSQHIHRCSEGNPLRKADYDSGRVRVYAINIPINIAIWVSAHRLRNSSRKRDRILGVVFPIVITVCQSSFALHNIRLKQRIQQGRD